MNCNFSSYIRHNFSNEMAQKKALRSKVTRTEFDSKPRFSISKQNHILFIIVAILLVWNIVQFGIAIEITGSATGTASLCINHIPTLDSIATNQTNHTENFLLNISASDTDNQNLTFKSNTSFITFIHINNTTSTMNISSNIALVGTYNITIFANDSQSCTPNPGSTNFQFTILNNAPVNNGTIPNQSWEEDTSLASFNISKYFTDADNNTLSFRADTVRNITINFTSNGTVLFSPTTDFYGNTSVTFYANDSVNETASNNVSLEITNTADICGNLICESSETCSVCSADCGACASTTPEGGGKSSSHLSSDSNSKEETSKESTSDEQTSTWDSIPVDWTANTIIDSENVAVKRFDFDVIKEVFNPHLRIGKVESFPISVSKVKDKIYQKLRITTNEPLQDKIELAEMTFEVEVSWLEDNNLEKEYISMYRFVDSEWTKLDTFLLEETSTIISYIAQTPGFSYFAIAQSDTPIPIYSQKTCTPNWICNNWGPESCPKEALQKRECNDENSCGSEYPPEEIRECVYLEQSFFAKASNYITDLFKSTGFALASKENKSFSIGAIAIMMIFISTIIGLIIYLNYKAKSKKNLEVSKQTLFSVENRVKKDSKIISNQQDITHTLNIKVKNKSQDELSIKSDFHAIDPRKRNLPPSYRQLKTQEDQNNLQNQRNDLPEDPDIEHIDL
jgi:PGF-pre-PGF domain-containing protein